MNLYEINSQILDCIDPETGEVIVPKSKMMTEADADAVVGAGITRVQIRSVLE